MDVEWNTGDPFESLDDRGADGQVRNEAPVHDVDVDPVGTAILDGGNRVAQVGEIGRQDRGRDPEAH